MTLTRPQTTILHVAASKLKWDDDTYRMVLVRIAGVTTSKDLDQAGFEAVMGFAGYCGFRPLAKGAPRYGDRPGMATFAQLELIRELWRELHDQTVCDDEHLTGWLLKYHKVSSMRFLTLDTARKVIVALKAWKARPRNRAARPGADQAKGRAEGSARSLAIGGIAWEGRERAYSPCSSLTSRKPSDPFNFAGIPFNFAIGRMGEPLLDEKPRAGHVFRAGVTR